MANPFAIAAALSKMVAITCPFCRHKKLVENKPAAHRVCARCHKQFPDPVAAKRKKR